MGSRTYLPTLFAIVHQLCVFIARYDSTIRANLSGDALTAYNALHVACDTFNTFSDVLNPIEP